MPRPRRFRHIRYMPDVTYFKPAGARLNELVDVGLTFEELEAIRLKDYLGLNQEEAAEQMNVSQPTFHRVLLSARKKVAEALILGKAISIKGGRFKVQKASIHKDVCICPNCGFETPHIPGKPCNTLRCEKCGTLLMRKL